MENNNLDRKKLLKAISALGKRDALKKAMEKNDYNAILSSLPENEAQELQALMSDKEARDKLLSSPQARELLRKLKNGNF